jgi:hypothetical protein
MEKDLSSYEKIILDKDRKAEIRIYIGDEDPNILNRKRIGIYLFVDNRFAASEWIECGKVVGNIIVSDPKITNERKKELVDTVIENLKDKWGEIKNDRC